MADNNCTYEITDRPYVSEFKFGRPIYAEIDSTLMVYFPNESIHQRRARIAEQMEALTLLMTANDGKDFDSMADPFQLTIRHMLKGMATELYALCDAIEEV